MLLKNKNCHDFQLSLGLGLTYLYLSHNQNSGPVPAVLSLRERRDRTAEIGTKLSLTQYLFRPGTRFSGLREYPSSSNSSLGTYKNMIFLIIFQKFILCNTSVFVLCQCDIYFYLNNLTLFLITNSLFQIKVLYASFYMQ